MLLMAGFLVGCGQDSKKSEAAAPAPAAQAQPAAPAPAPVAAQPDPVALLKGHVARLQKSCDDGEAINCRNKEGRVENHIGKPLRDLRYDVQRTSSLISPYVAQVSFQGDFENQGDGFRQYNITLALQDGEWVLSDLTDRKFYMGEWRDGDVAGLNKSIRQLDIDEYRQRMGVR